MRACVFLLVCVFFTCLVQAEDYYADVSVEVDGSGVSHVSGVSNHPLLQEKESDILTSKRGGYWLFNLTLPEEDVFSDFVYSVNLPEGAEVNYVTAMGQFRIISSGDRISVSGTGSDIQLSVLIQYRLSSTGKTDNLWYLFPVALFIILALGLYLRFRRRKFRGAYEPFLDALTERQKSILKLVSESGKPINQSLVCERLSLPKSSVSRNVNSLVRMGLVEKTRVGVSTFLSLKKP